jgi:hypothetical protein
MDEINYGIETESQITTNIESETNKQSNEFYNINISLLEKKHPHIFKLVKAYEDGTYISKVKDAFDLVSLGHADDGEIINVIVEKNNNKYFLCDHNNPQEQANKWLELTIDETNKIELIFGMGLGYNIEAILEKYSSKRIMIIEPSIELFVYLISSRDMSKIFDNNKCWILLEDEFDTFLKNFLILYWDAKNKGIFKLQSINVYSLIFNEIWDEFREKFKKQMNALVVDTTTRKMLTELWLTNYITNIPRMKDASNADGFLGKFKDVPGILVSAGSSLEGNVHLLKDIKDKCLILSASSARIAMKQFDVSPHMFMTVDASEGESRIVENVENDNEYMVYSNQLAPKSLEIYDGKKIFINYNSDFYTTNFLAWAGIQSGFVMSAPSVANTCLDFLVRLGCNPIIFIGQDLSFTKNKQYAGEIDYGVDMEEQGFKDAGYPLVEDIYGNGVYTMPPFLAMRNCFEDQIKSAKLGNPDLDVINCTEGGINIDGARNEKLEDIIKTFDNISQENSVINLIEQLYQNNMFGDFSEKISNFNKFLLAELDGLTNQINEQKKMLNKVERFKVTKTKESKVKFDKLLLSADNMSKVREEAMIYKLLLSPLLQVDLFQMGIKFVQENEHEKDFTKKRKVYLGTLREQISIIEGKVKIIEGLLSEK